MHHVRFVCGRNRLRSPTAEHLFAEWPGIGTTSAGTSHDADRVVSAGPIDRADTILVMGAAHRSRTAAPNQRQVPSR